MCISQLAKIVLKYSSEVLGSSTSHWGRQIFFFLQAEDGIRGGTVTGVQTCALPIFLVLGLPLALLARKIVRDDAQRRLDREATSVGFAIDDDLEHQRALDRALLDRLAGEDQIGRASCRETG